MIIPTRAWRLAALVLVAVGLAAACVARRDPPATLESAATFDAAWEIVRDTHFDVEFNGVDWEAVREELRPRAIAAKDAEELAVVLDELLERLGQSHFARLPANQAPTPGTAAGGAEPGLEAGLLPSGEVVVLEVDPEGPAFGAGVRAGWLLKAVDGTPVSTLGGPIAVRNARIAELLDGTPGSTAQLEFEDGASRSVTLETLRRIPPGEVARFGNLPPFLVRFEARDIEDGARGIVAGYLRFNVWLPSIAARFDEAIDRFRESDGVVLDLRGNPGGVAGLVLGTAGHFLDRRVDLGTMKTRESELRFYANPRIVTPDGRRVEPFSGPLAILVDERTASTSEVFAGGMQDLGRARIFGVRTAGAVLPALADRLPNGDVLYHAVADYRTPSGVVLEGRGVQPDVTTPVTREDLLAGRDAALEAALDWIAAEAAEENAR